MELEFLDTQCVGIVSTDVLKTNMDAALARGYPVVRKLESNNRPLAIVGGGPSVADDVEELRNWKGEIWAVNGALGWLIEKGIKPDAMVMMDPHPSMTQFLSNPPDVTYYILSFCDPSVFDCLEGKNVIIWHGGGKECPPPKGQGSVGGGPTIMSRAPMLAFCLGYRDVHLYGADSCYDYGDHVYDVTLADGVPPDELMYFQLDDVVYASSIVLVHQTAYFQAIHAFYKQRNANFEIHGRGLGPAILKAKMHSVEELTAA